jgi:alkanesulfonate monooxygenase SsuD/methylene tetrahydromethanopterin reductase-like flavin-dependent oxidoreductase (luciferase family)
MARTPSPHLAVALDGAGWHPAAWREPSARPTELFTAGYWADLATEAERGLLDFVTIEDSLSLQSTDADGPDGRTDQVRGRLDAVLVAARIAPRTRHIGLVPTAVVTHTEPFHLSKAIATLDYVSSGRAGVRARATASPADAKHFGRTSVPEQRADLLDEAADYVEVVRRLWDSWEDDAEIRDAATGRFIDRDKLHYIDFAGRWFSVKGPSITPRPPQGQPLVAVLAHGSPAYQLAARTADVVFVTPADVANPAAVLAEVDTVPHVFADLAVFLDRDGVRGADRKERLDTVAGNEFSSDAAVFTGTASELADVIESGWRAGLSGFRLRPAALPDDLTSITRDLVPLLQARGLFRREYESGTLRARLGLPRPANRYAA